MIHGARHGKNSKAGVNLLRIQYQSLETCAAATGTVVAVDVLRAFTSAAYAFAAGASEILIAGSVEQAFALCQRFPGYLVMGEVNGLKVPGFDFSNSPNEISRQDLSNCGLIQRTSAGTQGLVRSLNAEHLLAASFVVARATARAILHNSPNDINFVITGLSPGSHYDPDQSNHSLFGDEDAACADYIAQLLQGAQPDSYPYLQRVLDSPTGQIFANSARPELPAADLDLCIALDRFDFALQVSRRDDLLVMERLDFSDE